MPLQFYTPETDNLQYQSSNNKQGRSGIVDKEIYDQWVSRHEKAKSLASYVYVQDLEDEIARELARIDLPLSTYTEWYWKMDLHNLFHLLGLRCDSHAQWEIREFADVMAGIVSKVTPIAYEAWLDYQYCAVTFSYQEMQLLLSKINGGENNTSNLSRREIEEFENKLQPVEKPIFSIDLENAKTPQYFREESEKYVPQINKETK
jgi:thymidylate synthase (FAD)